MESYNLNKNDILNYSQDEDIFKELQAHRCINDRTIIFPEKFKIVIDESDQKNDDSTLLYYEINSLNDI